MATLALMNISTLIDFRKAFDIIENWIRSILNTRIRKRYINLVNNSKKSLPMALKVHEYTNISIVISSPKRCFSWYEWMFSKI